jgi:hypothetical protein
VSAADADDRQAIAAVVRAFFGAFTTEADSLDRLQQLRELFLPGAVIVRTCGNDPVLYDVDGFIRPRQELLGGGTVRDFREWELAGHTDLFGDVASHVCSYAKSWVHEGTTVTGRGMKTLQLVRTREGWRISAAAWDDERPGVALDPSHAGEAAGVRPRRSRTTLTA